ncbi:MAG: phosphoglycerate mutase family protein [Alphaproteobacteria bacterium]|nr:phosphoglycerate mutase family protein [Alphaproteobacteria bacterium]
MTVKLLIARHGNTFAPNETPRRIGAKTDLQLVESGVEQAKKLGEWLKANNLLPDIVYTSRLKRTIETAENALASAGIRRALHQSDLFDEIDHGPDENRPEPEVAARIGADAYNKWEHESVMPKEWAPQPDVLRRRWFDFAKHCEQAYDNKTVLIVTSNGVARFAPLLANNADDMCKGNKRKMGTGALSIFEGSGGLWMISHWNVKP